MNWFKLTGIRIICLYPAKWLGFCCLSGPGYSSDTVIALALTVD